MTKKHAFLIHEVFQMSAFLMRAIDSELLARPAIEANEEWPALATNTHQALSDRYQMIAASTLENEQP